MQTHRLAGWLALILLVLSVNTFGCNIPPRESPWEPVPANYTATLTAIAQRVTPSTTPMPAHTATSVPSKPLFTPTLAALPVNGITARLNETFTLGISQWATLTDAKNTRVFFTSLLEDTRCALDINCFQAGKTRVAVTVESDGKLARFDLSSSPTDHRRVGAFNNYLVEFVDLAPARKSASVPIPLNDYPVTLRVTPGSLNATHARLNEPFTLKLGQAIDFDDAPLQLLFEAVQQDSRCPARVLCATSGSATLIVRATSGAASTTTSLELGGKGMPIIPLSDRLATVTMYANALTPHPQQEFASKEISPNEYTATLLVATAGVFSTPSTPQALTTCPHLARGDASEILGQALQEKPANMVLFHPTTNAFIMRGICGYGSIAFTPNKTRTLNLPGVSPASAQADYAVVAGKFTDSQRLEQLVSLASAIESANPHASGILVPKLLTLRAAGVWYRDMIGDFPDAARNATGVTVTHVANLGDTAIWVWREFAGGRYAALVAQKGETLFVLTALADEQRAQEAMRLTMTSAMQKMLR